jgi:integrase
MVHQKSIIEEALERLDSLKAIGESRREAKARLRGAGARQWSVSTGKIHSHITRQVYQQHVLLFINWARDTFEIKRLQDLDDQSEHLVVLYLHMQIEAHKSPYTLQAKRSAFRLFFRNPHLAKKLPLPPRRREQIHRSRVPVKRDRDFQPANWQALIGFLQATGLRRAEIRQLQVEDIQQEPASGRVEVVIKKGNGKGGRPRRVPVLPGKEAVVLAQKAERSPEELVFPRIPSHLDIHAIRRQYAQAYYHCLTAQALPLTAGQLEVDEYNEAAVHLVSQALGHNRKQVVIYHYLS